MRVVVTGGTGLIGRRLIRRLVDGGHEITVLSRSDRPVAGATLRRWDGRVIPSAAMEGVEGIVNLAGTSVGNGRWTQSRRRDILDSRISATRACVDAIAAADGVRVLVNASAVGYYGNQAQEVDETSLAGGGFLAEVVNAWEDAALRAEAHGARVVRMRTGVVLDRHEGALPRLVLPTRFGMGGPLGDGRQWYPWIHIEDIAAMFEAALVDERWSGPVVGAAPTPVTQRDFARVLGGVLHRPAVIPTPAIALRLMLGAQASVALEGQHALPNAARRLGFTWAFPALESALRDLLGRPDGDSPHLASAS